METQRTRKKQKLNRRTKKIINANIKQNFIKEIKTLKSRIEIETPIKGSSSNLQYSKFSELPISRRTLEGLNSKGFIDLTPVQSSCISRALAGRDILGSAKTGSGKTLAFLIPVLELLYRMQWEQSWGLGALIISPTRELAIQIFEVLVSIGKGHSFSAGLVIGGKDFNEEKNRINQINILVSTPGRMKQHLEQTPNFDINNLQILVLDEADRILDSGFKNTIQAILQSLPSERQTLLFSATISSQVIELAGITLNQPERIAVDAENASATPEGLRQGYMICEAHEKYDFLYSFIKSHLKQKLLTFVSSCKQSRFLYEMFRRLRTGINVMFLHGRMKQNRRINIFYEFMHKDSAILFATDIAARGLDIPEVDWVIQLDCPDSVDSYIHRVGRTARYNKEGSALLFILPSEIKMIEKLKSKKISVQHYKANPSKILQIKERFASSIASDSTGDLKHLAETSFISYLKSIQQMPDKEIFNIKSIDYTTLAQSMGLLSIPKIIFSESKSGQVKKNLPYAMIELFEKKSKNKSEKLPSSVQMLSRKNMQLEQWANNSFRSKLRAQEEDEESEFFTSSKSIPSSTPKDIIVDSYPTVNDTEIKAHTNMIYQKIKQSNPEDNKFSANVRKERKRKEMEKRTTKFDEIEYSDNSEKDSESTNEEISDDEIGEDFDEKSLENDEKRAIEMIRNR